MNFFLHFVKMKNMVPVEILLHDIDVCYHEKEIAKINTKFRGNHIFHIHKMKKNP